ncbi:MAG: preprotein translocase subunit SecE [Chloroflexi bacterium]|nr:preprotein translocase subunit SecE [Chloroflexota bacterium]
MAKQRVARRQQTKNPVARYFIETRAELRKVNWPTRKEAISLTRIVLIVMFLMGMFLWLLDLGFFQIFAWLLSS